MPVFQWLYFDALECLPEEDPDSVLSEESCKPVSTIKTFKANNCEPCETAFFTEFISECKL